MKRNQDSVSSRFKRQAIRKAMIDYYDTINSGKFALPSFLLAAWAIKNTKAYDRLNVLYERLEG